MIAATRIDRQRSRELDAPNRFRENRGQALRAAAAGGRDRAVPTGRRNDG